MLHLLEREKFIVEGAGACPLAAIMGNLVPELKLKKYVIVNDNNYKMSTYIRVLVSLNAPISVTSVSNWARE